MKSECAAAGDVLRTCKPYALLLICLLTMVPLAKAQTESATLSGTVMDRSGAVVPAVEVHVTNSDTNVSVSTMTNNSGVYVVPSLKPGRYRLAVTKQGFKQVVVTDVVLNVQDAVSRNFTLDVGATSESITVTADELNINTTNATVSTVIDRNFAANLPLNGRSFQTLIQLTPGVVLTTTNFSNPGQFSVNGQRASSNYFTVDGVSANIGMNPSATLSQGASGAIPGVSITGGTNNLVSVDALQEFRIQTSTYAPEFGRTPGGQISVVTRSGSNDFHGNLFEYFRNEVLDSNDWFANRLGLPKAKLRQNDFGGTLGGPIVKNRMFFFASYEGQRLRLPETGISTVPSQATRQAASADVRPFLDAFPIPNGADLGNGQSEFNATFSNASSLNAASVRVDHRLSDKLSLFGRYNYAPSDLVQRGAGGFAGLSTSTSSKINTQTLTLGSTWLISTSLSNELRFNYSRNTAALRQGVDEFGGASTPADSILFPSPFSSENSQFTFSIFSLQRGAWTLGRNADNLQRQLNIVDGLSVQRGTHSLKFGIDYRRLSPRFKPQDYFLQVGFLDVPSVLAGNAFFIFKAAGRSGTVGLHDFGAYAQDSWRINSRLTLTYGLRWELEPPPSTTSGPDLFAVNSIEDAATLAIAPAGTPLWKTRYGNFAPRVGLAYQVSDKANFETVFRGGFGLFYDLATQQIGDAFFLGTFPFSASSFICCFGLPFPLTPDLQQPPAFEPLPSPLGNLASSDPQLELPYTLQWNIAMEQGLGSNQAISLTYIGAVGRRLLMTESLLFPNPNLVVVSLARNGATSDYHALQVQFQRRISKGLHALASYSWAHSIDSGSSSTGGAGDALFTRRLDSNINRGPSNFDVRHAFSAAISYDIPSPQRSHAVLHAVLGGWSLDNIIQARTATPVVVFDQRFRFVDTFAAVRPDVVPGVPFYLTDPSFAGGTRINPAAFQPPPLDPVTGFVVRQGTLSRNALRGFGAAQWDFAVRRQFNFSERWRLQFRAEFFNLLNHPNFGNPEGNLASPLFGQSTQMLGRSLGGATDPGVGFTPLYQVGGPRSIQLALKLEF